MTIIIFMACNECIECCLVSDEVYTEDMYECCMHDMRYLETIFSFFSVIHFGGPERLDFVLI